jgi:cytosol aminopeptidase
LQSTFLNIFTTVGCRSLQEVEVTNISVDSLGNAEAAAEGATLGIWKYQGPKSKKPKALPSISPYNDESGGWNSGVIKADAQNFARRLMDTPGNLMTPTIFAQVSIKDSLYK